MAYASKSYDYDTKKDTSCGTVTTREVKTHFIDVTVNPFEAIGADDEIVIAVNGRTVKRMDIYQANRMGLLINSENYNKY